MKIQCDVCNENEASVYCSADEAALCSACDHRVHHANKLAGKHPRFSLLHPKDSPVCDICQEKKAFLFCQQDRAILCKDCDVAIHKVNQHTQNHNRFLLTGVKLSPTASLYSSATPPAAIPTAKNSVAVPEKQQPEPLPSPIMKQNTLKTPDCRQESNGSGHSSTTSSISEYLIEMLPGWHVEDFLDAPPNFSKVGEKDPSMIWGDDLLDGSLNSSFSPESMGMWVPQAPPPAAPPPPPPPPPSRYTHLVQQFEPRSHMGFGDQIINGSSLVFAPNNYSNLHKITNSTKSSRKRTSDNGNCFTVPQITPPTTTSKRSRTLWH